MKNRPPSGPAAEMVRELVHSMGYHLLEFSHQPVKGRVHVHCVLHADSMDVDRLSDVHRALQPRLEELLGDNMRLEFSSAGLGRTLKSFHELPAFVGERVDVLAAGEDRWFSGTIEAADAETVTLSRAEQDETMTYTAETIQKIRLADTYAGGTM